MALAGPASACVGTSERRQHLPHLLLEEIVRGQERRRHVPEHFERDGTLQLRPREEAAGQGGGG
jgi:hypothetical protein